MYARLRGTPTCTRWGSWQSTVQTNVYTFVRAHGYTFVRAPRYARLRATPTCTRCHVGTPTCLKVYMFVLLGSCALQRVHIHVRLCSKVHLHSVCSRCSMPVSSVNKLEPSPASKRNRVVSHDVVSQNCSCVCEKTKILETVPPTNMVETWESTVSHNRLRLSIYNAILSSGIASRTVKNCWELRTVTNCRELSRIVANCWNSKNFQGKGGKNYGYPWIPVHVRWIPWIPGYPTFMNIALASQALVR